jgi:hypothetical protein
LENGASTLILLPSIAKGTSPLSLLQIGLWRTHVFRNDPKTKQFGIGHSARRLKNGLAFGLACGTLGQRVVFVMTEEHEYTSSPEKIDSYRTSQYSSVYANAHKKYVLISI